MAIFRPAMRIAKKLRGNYGGDPVYEYALEVRNDVWNGATMVKLPTKIDEERYERPYPWRRHEEDARLDAQTFIREQFNKQREVA